MFKVGHVITTIDEAIVNAMADDYQVLRTEVKDLKETILYLTERIDALEPVGPDPNDYTFLPDDLLDDPNAYEWSEMVQDPSYTEEVYKQQDNIWR